MVVVKAIKLIGGCIISTPARGKLEFAIAIKCDFKWTFLSGCIVGDQDHQVVTLEYPPAFIFDTK